MPYEPGIDAAGHRPRATREQDPPMHIAAPSAGAILASASSADERDAYGALHHAAGLPAADILARFACCLPERRCEFDRKGRGDAVNWALYGYDAGQAVAIVQCRQAVRRYRNGFLNLRKTYNLVG